MHKKKPIVYPIDHKVLKVLMKDLNPGENKGTEDKRHLSVIVHWEPTSRLVRGVLFSTGPTGEYPSPGSLSTNVPTHESEAL